MVNCNTIGQKFPNIKELEPDKQIILFAQQCAKAGVYIDDMDLIIGMLKYVLNGRVNNYKNDFMKLYQLYTTVFA